jgi:hypothetical protein
MFLELYMKYKNEVLRMASYWTKQEQELLVKAIPLYRQQLKQSKAPEKVTLELAKHLHLTYPELFKRTVTAIRDRLPYIENLVAGVFDRNDYAKKDQYLYASLPRESDVLKPNPCHTRHKYNGALAVYRKKNFNIAN